MINKRDLIRSRTPTDTEYRYELGKITQKVDKEPGKGLSTNDFTDDYRQKVENIAKDRHRHNNLDVLNTITESKVISWNNKASEKNIITLFDGINNGDVILNDEITNYDLIAIVYGTSTCIETKAIIPIQPTKQICFVINTDSTTSAKAWYKVYDNNITKITTTNKNIYVYKVVGFKYAKGGM